MKRALYVSICKMFGAAIMVLSLAAGASAQNETILYSFTGGSDGGIPVGGVVFDTKGNLYGTAETGGANFAGDVYELSPNASGTWTETVIYSFAFNGIDGYLPACGLVFDAHGNLYGETGGGGATGGGIIFELTPSSSGTWTEKILYNFAGGTDGNGAYGTQLTLDSVGNIYGTTTNGGLYGFGTVFALVPGANGTWTKKTLHSFASGNDGGTPYAEALVLDSAGSIYGTTLNGGADDYGVVFELTRASSGAWSEKILHAFTGTTDGSGPEGGVVFDASGNLYGSSVYSVFQLVPTASGSWTENIIHTFGGGADGSGPDSILAFDKAGNLYGTTNAGGKHRGTVFELTPHSNGSWTETILHKFSPTGGDGFFPFFSGLAIDSNGDVFGTTSGGGSSNNGVVYEITPLQ